ncbi:MAG: hypothetical protein AAF078_07915 [Planctomycetota bacterium]
MAISALGSVVRTVKVSISEPSGACQVSHRPASASRGGWAAAAAASAGGADPVRLLVAAALDGLPLVEPGRGHDAPPAAQRRAERGLVGGRLGPGVEKPLGDAAGVGVHPVRDQTPAHGQDLAGAVGEGTDDRREVRGGDVEQRELRGHVAEGLGVEQGRQTLAWDVELVAAAHGVSVRADR